MLLCGAINVIQVGLVLLLCHAFCSLGVTVASKDTCLGLRGDFFFCPPLGKAYGMVSDWGEGMEEGHAIPDSFTMSRQVTGDCSLRGLLRR